MFNWKNLPEGKMVKVYYEGWQPVIRTNGTDKEDTLSFNSLESAPYKFPSYSKTGWGAFNSTLVYIKTGNNPMTIYGITSNNKPIKGIVGIWWETGWVGMGKPKIYPVVIPPHQKAIIQINHNAQNIKVDTTNKNRDILIAISGIIIAALLFSAKMV